MQKISIITIFLFVCLLHGLFSIKLLYMKYLSSRSKSTNKRGSSIDYRKTDEHGSKRRIDLFIGSLSKNQIETANIKARQMYLVQMHGDEWQLVAKKMMAGFSSSQVSPLAPCCLLAENRVYLL